VSHYVTLGVAPDASHAQIRAAYRDLARQVHPDRVAAGQPLGAGRSMAAVNEAYRVLSDPGRRVVYDRSLSAAQAATSASGAVHADDDDDDDDDDGRNDGVEDRCSPPPNRLSPAGPARVPWRLMGAAALFGSGAVLVSSFFADSPAAETPDGIIEPGSCVAFEVNGDAREVACGSGSGNDVVVRMLVPLDATCPADTVGHRDRLGLGIACVAG
jgi:molecular chaperone DnaJ